MLPREGEEFLCLTANRFSPPAQIIHAPGARAYRADFGTDTGQGSTLDTALGAAGAVFPSMPETGGAAVAMLLALLLTLGSGQPPAPAAPPAAPAPVKSAR
ncbi:hypothetical protein ACGRHY_28160 [Streptomyces sp. HK10]|uniref:hypothetical protein n=1 Tax=Streptomyces sp. HK10 TaxID=3373255 RepID=UPI003748BCF6